MLAGDLSGGDSDMKASVASLHFILSKAAGHGVDDATLFKELQQLGLPKEHSESVCRPYRERGGQLHEKLRHCVPLTGGAVEGVDWEVSYVATVRSSGGSESAEGAAERSEAPPPSGERVLHLQLNHQTEAGGGESKSVRLSMTAGKAHVLLAELQKARAAMQTKAELG